MEVIHVIAPVAFGGGENVLLELAKGGPKTKVILLARSPIFEKEMKKKNIVFFTLCQTELAPNASKMRFLMLLFFGLIKIDKFRDQINRGSIVHCHGFPAIIFGSLHKLLFRKCDCKYVYTHHQQVIEISTLQKLIFNPLYNLYDCLTFVSKSIRERFLTQYNVKKTKTVVVYNPIASNFYKEQISSASYKDRIKFIYPARFSKQKNHLALIESFILFRERYNYLPSIQISLYGIGELLGVCSKLVEDNSLNEIFEFCGFVENDKLPLILESYHASIFPSYLEGFGVAAAECLASGLPVIYNKHNTTLCEVIDSGGWPVNIEDLPRFCDKLTLNEIIDKKSDCARIAALYRPNQIIKSYESVYNSI